MSVADKYRAKLGVAGQAQTPEAPATGSVADKYRSRLPQLDARPAEEELGPDNSNWLDRVNAAGQGLSFGFADEAGSALAATAAKIGGSDEDWSDIYGSMMESEQGKREHFAEHNPIENLALQVGGGLVTGGAGLVKAVPTLAAKLGGGKLATLGATSIVGATEGGIAGFGTTDGDLGERAEGAGKGAVVGGVLPVGMHATGKALRAAGNNRVAKDLVDKVTGKFTPLTVADKEGWLGDAYRTLIAPAFGSGKLKEQVKPFAEAANRKVTALTKAVGRVKIGGKKKIAQAKAAMVNKGEAQTLKIDQTFRREALDAATPAQMPANQRALLDSEDPQTAFAQLDNFWLNNGFKSAKNKVYDLDVDEFNASMKGLFHSDPALRGKAGDFLPDVMGDFNNAFTRPPQPRARTGVTSIAPPRPTKGTMKGDELMELRNKYARMANDKDADGLARTAYRKISDRIDTMVKKGLADDPAALAQYNDDLSRWAAFSTYGKATGSAANKKAGVFDSDDWLSQTKNYKLKSKKGVLQESAQGNQAQKKGLEKAVKQQIVDNPVKQNMADMNTKVQRRLTAAKENAKEMKTLSGSPANLFRTLAATGTIGQAAKVLGRGLFTGVDTVATGTLGSRVLNTQKAQQVLAGQTSPQKALANVLRKYDKSKITDLVRGAPSAAIAGREEEIEDLIYGSK